MGSISRSVIRPACLSIKRANRARLRMLRPKRLLNNPFAYNLFLCSVVAALDGAETVSVDLYRARSLTRGEGNFRRNGLDPKADHRLIADDVLAVSAAVGAARARSFDAIILIGPTFSRIPVGCGVSGAARFRPLVALALEVAAPEAKILFFG